MLYQGSNFAQRWQPQVADHGHRQKEVFWVVVKRDESEFQIPVSGLIIQCIDFHRPDTNLFRDVLSTPQSVQKEQGTQPLPLHTLIDSQTAEKDNGHVH